MAWRARPPTRRIGAVTHHRASSTAGTRVSSAPFRSWRRAKSTRARARGTNPYLEATLKACCACSSAGTTESSARAVCWPSTPSTARGSQRSQRRTQHSESDAAPRRRGAKLEVELGLLTTVRSHRQGTANGDHSLGHCALHIEVHPETPH